MAPVKRLGWRAVYFVLYVYAPIGWAVVRVGYMVRPYDMLADRRRWRWQPRAVCLRTRAAHCWACRMDREPKCCGCGRPLRATP